MHSRTKPKLLVQVRDLLRRRHYSYSTENTYITWIRRYIYFHNKLHPSEVGPHGVVDFLTHLAVEGKVSPSTQNQALNGIVYLYKEVLQKDPETFDGIIWARRPKHTPAVLERAPKEMFGMK